MSKRAAKHCGLVPLPVGKGHFFDFDLSSVKAPFPAPEYVPKASAYQFDKTLLEDLQVGIRLGLNILLTGPTGCGKTSLPTQLAARAGYPTLRFNMDGETRVTHLRGQQKPVAVNGVLSLEFEYGLLALAMKQGWWVVLDEIDAASPAVLFVLQSVLEEGNRSIQIPETGERIEAHPSFRLFATANTVGYRATSRAKHAGTNVLNTAFVDRFGMVLGVDYPERETEFAMLSVHLPEFAATEDGEVLLAAVTHVAEVLRKATTFRSDFSTRRAIQWGRLMSQYPRQDGPFPFDVLRSAELSFIRKIESPNDAKVARETIQRVFGYEDQ